MKFLCAFLIAGGISSFLLHPVCAFLPSSTAVHSSLSETPRLSQCTTVVRLFDNGDGDKDEATIEEEQRLKIYESRRGQIRASLKSAESIRNLRLKNGWVPELDEEGKPIKSDSKFALSATAFVVAGGAIALRIGGRAALVSAVGLDFLTGNPELQGQMNQVLSFSESMDPLARLGLFSLAWTGVKVLCFDAGGVVLALSSGILFGGVLQGAIVSAFGATVGSSVAFTLAKLDTPVRKKALEIVEDNPSLKGIERVVAADGLKAILTLRLAPVLPIPIGLYNYVYGVTNVPYFDFAGGIFLGSLKPYLLDSYLGYFGKEVIDGTAGTEGGIQDVLLLVALGFSVLIGVFASQLAGETWDAVLQEEQEAAKQKKLEEGEEPEDESDDGIVREVFGAALPQWMVGFQLALGEADDRISDIIINEIDAKVWNYTDSTGDNPIPRDLDPAYRPASPEITGSYEGIKMGALTCDGIVLSPNLFGVFFKLADPLYNEETFKQEWIEAFAKTKPKDSSSSSPSSPSSSSTAAAADTSVTKEGSANVVKGDLINRLQSIRDRTVARIEELDKRLES
jgi:uncharacterized membrane protein YdjX (TVP38/TMEM64 family)